MYDLDLDSMTLILKLNLGIVKIYTTKMKFLCNCCKSCSGTDSHTDRHTHTYTHTTNNITHTSYAGGNKKVNIRNLAPTLTGSTMFYDTTFIFMPPNVCEIIIFTCLWTSSWKVSKLIPCPISELYPYLIQLSHTAVYFPKLTILLILR